MSGLVGSEDTAIRSIASIGLNDRDASWPGAPLADEAWRRVIHRVKDERIIGLLAQAVETGRLPATPEQRDRLRREQTADLHTCLLLEAHLLEAVATLASASVPVRVLKGAAVAHLDYDDPSHRSFRDVDLLIPAECFDDAVRALTAAGGTRRYREVRPGFDRRFGKGACLVAPSGLETDLHRTFVMGPYGLWIDVGALWQASTPVVIGGRELEGLAVDLRFLHACYHAALGEVQPRLAMLRDVAQLLVGRRAAVDVDRVRAVAAAWHGEAVVARAVSLTWEALDLPEGPLSQWARSHRRRRIDDRAMATYLDPSLGFAARSVMAVRAVPGWRAKASFAYAMAMPSSSYGAGRHHSRAQRWRSALGETWRLRGRRR